MTFLLRLIFFLPLLLFVFSCSTPLPMQAGACINDLTFISNHSTRQAGCMFFVVKNSSDLVYLIRYKENQFFFCDKKGSCDIEMISFPSRAKGNEIAVAVFPPPRQGSVLVPNGELAARCQGIFQKPKGVSCWNYEVNGQSKFPKFYEKSSEEKIAKCWFIFKIVFARHTNAQCQPFMKEPPPQQP